jgi:beta-glucosidase
VVRAFARAMNEGILSVDRNRKAFRGIISTAKHYIADGGSTQGIDQGNVLASEAELMNIHAQGYFGAIEAGVQTVMVGFFSWQDQGKDVGNAHLVDEILKQKISWATRTWSTRSSSRRSASTGSSSPTGTRSVR